MKSAEAAGGARGFLFADLRDYSAWVERHGDHAAVGLLDTYREIVRGATAAQEGVEIRTEGDSFYVVFRSPSAAILAGLDIVDRAATSAAPDGSRVRVGVGIHAGEAVEVKEGYVGSAVNIAARVCAQAATGEVLVSEAVRLLTRTFTTVGFVPLGRRRLKGIAEPVALYRVTRDGASGARAKLSGRRAHLGLAVGVAGVVLGLAVAAFVVASNLRPGGDALRQASIEPAGETAQESASPGTWTSAEEALLSRLSPDVRRHCDRAAESDIPTHLPETFNEQAPLPRIPLALRAGFACTIGGPSSPSTVYVFHAFREDDIEEAWHLRTGRSIATGDCQDSSSQNVHGRWNVGNVGGRLMCVVARDRATIAWTYDGDAIWAEARRDDDDLATLLRWWREHRLLGTDES